MPSCRGFQPGHLTFFHPLVGCGDEFAVFSGDRDTGVRVVLRARPLNSLERSKAAESLCIGIDGDSVECKVAKQDHAGTVRFSFDRVFGPDSEQKQVYDFIGPQAINGALFLDDSDP